MKLSIFSTALFFFFLLSFNANAQWQINGTNINNTNSGKIGIGLGNAGTPAYKLHVVGDRIRLGNNSTATAKTIDLRTDGTQLDIVANNGHLFLGSATGNTIIQGSGRRVGIGTGTPEAELHVVGTESNGSTSSTLKLTSGTQNMLFDGNEIDVAGGGIHLQNNSTGDLYMVNGGGKVGIGTTSAAYKMHVVGNRIRLGNNELSTAKTIDLRTDGTQLDIMANNGHLFIGSSTGNTIIQGFGRKVGIGTGTPEAELHVNGTESNGTTGAFKITSGTQNLVFDGNEIDASNALYLQNNSSGHIVLASGGGSVRIGSDATPSSKLDVSGDVRCFNIFTNSDRRYKTDIRTFEGALGKVLAMRGTSYDFAADKIPADYLAGKQVGFIAQEMKEVMPELVKTDAEGMMSVNYIGVIPVLVEALKEQHEVIEEKETRIAALEVQNNELKDRLARIEAALGIASDRQETPAANTAVASPNPTSGIVTISLNNTTSAKSVTVKIMDNAGREIASRNAAGASSVQFDLTQCTSGVYVAQVIADGKVVSTNKVQLVK